MDYKAFYEKVGAANGWSFDKLHVRSEGIEWDFYKEVSKKISADDIALDIGTGGGENSIKLAPFLLLLIGIDLSAEMIETAELNLKKTEMDNVKYFQMDSEALQFPDAFFDVLSCRHAPFSAKEAARVLKNSGWFLTQQVSEADKYNLKQAFGRGQAIEETDGALKERCISELNEAGFSVIYSMEYDAAEYYQRPEDLMFLLKHTPIIPEFGRQKRDFEIFEKFIEDNWTVKGIKTNSKRFLLMAEK